MCGVWNVTRAEVEGLLYNKSYVEGQLSRENIVLVAEQWLFVEERMNDGVEDEIGSTSLAFLSILWWF